ncbi:hypothetical protein [Plasmodium yoelii yoelii]|uniref:Uncharacterized protein n=1 Tax=Plasmodium yoelii yoelii TaxID=73239 RepID=Q7RET9_PLAYO|nr:hypothetical protein [Plasmodium yoelii yoelii]
MPFLERHNNYRERKKKKKIYINTYQCT